MVEKRMDYSLIKKLVSNRLMALRSSQMLLMAPTSASISSPQIWLIVAI